MTDYRNTSWRRSAQGDRLEKISTNFRTQPGAAVPHDPCETINQPGQKIWLEKVNGFWVRVCQVVLISEGVLAENPIDCRIYFADNPR
jgi:hypothetical protein